MPIRTPGNPLPDELGGPLEKLVYLYVRDRGSASITELRDVLNVPKLRLYPTVKTLAARELVEYRGEDVWIPTGFRVAGTHP